MNWGSGQGQKSGLVTSNPFASLSVFHILHLDLERLTVINPTFLCFLHLFTFYICALRWGQMGRPSSPQTPNDTCRSCRWGDPEISWPSGRRSFGNSFLRRRGFQGPRRGGHSSARVVGLCDRPGGRVTCGGVAVWGKRRDSEWFWVNKMMRQGRVGVHIVASNLHRILTGMIPDMVCTWVWCAETGTPGLTSWRQSQIRLMA